MVKVVKKLSKGDIARVLLETVKISGSLATVLVAPHVLYALKKTGIVDLNPSKKKIITNARLRLTKAGFLERDNKGFLKLTKKGEDRLRTMELSNYELKIPRIWDKKWRTLIFDIPEYRKPLRNKIRRTLQVIGFKRVQDSVWVFPYDCSELVALLKADFKVGKDLLYLVVDSLENDESLRAYFNLN